MKKTIKLFSIILLLVLTITLTVSCIKSVEDYYNDTDMEGDLSGFISINCNTISSNPDRLADLPESMLQFIPDDGWILSKTIIRFDEGDSVYDVLMEVSKIFDIPVVAESTFAVYIQGINHLFEFAAGDLSGWKYRVNGEFSSVGADALILKDGDNIEWLYSCDLGEDIGSDWEGA